MDLPCSGICPEAISGNRCRCSELGSRRETRWNGDDVRLTGWSSGRFSGRRGEEGNFSRRGVEEELVKQVLLDVSSAVLSAPPFKRDADYPFCRLQLLSSLYDEALLSHSSFLRFLVQQIESSVPSQLPFVLFLVEEYLAEFLQTEPLAARMVSACLTRVEEVRFAALRFVIC